MTVRRALNLLTDRTFILLAAFAGGLIFGGAASSVGFLTIPALVVILTVSTMQFSAREFIPPTRVIRPVLTALALNFALLGSVILVLAWWLMPSRELWIGCVLVAVAPPGVAIIPFTHVLQGDSRVSMQGTFGAYLVCLLLTPALIHLLTGTSTVAPSALFRIILLLVLAPFIAAQLVNMSPAARWIKRWRGNIINWGFFFVTFTVVGLNRSVFLSEPQVLVAVSVPAVASSFGLCFVVDSLGKRLGVARATRSSAILLSTIKNSAFAAAIGLGLYGEASSIPGAVFSAWYALYFIYLGIKGDRERVQSPDRS
jgi:BASS family bile acid:Na+ symporter